MIEIVPYDPRWSREFEAERGRIQAAFGSRAIRIDHNGSTAVPGLAAKPVIDIQISVEPLHPAVAYAPLLENLGYSHGPHADDDPCPFFHRPATWPHTHHVHLVEAAATKSGTLGLSRPARAPEAAWKCETLKRRSVAEHRGLDASSREAYAIAKTAFVEHAGVTDAAAIPNAPPDSAGASNTALIVPASCRPRWV